MLRTRHRTEIGRGRPLVGWDISSFAEFAFVKLGLVEDETAEAVEVLIFAADKHHAGEVTLSEFELLFCNGVSAATTRRKARALLIEASAHEKTGNLKAAEAKCEASIEVWPACAEAHLNLARLLRAGGASVQRAITKVETHLRQAVACASPSPLGNEGGGEVEEAAASLLSLLLCQEGRDAEVAILLKDRGLRYSVL
ncbi:unnamed protein product [Choristocarpus tenellus]